MKIDTIKIDVNNDGHFTNTYILHDEEISNNPAVIIDPASDSHILINKIKEENLDVKYIVITHGHADHIGALSDILEFTNAKIIIHKNDKDALIGKKENYSEALGMSVVNINENNILSIEDGYTFNVENMNFEVIHTPGHTSGAICIYEKNDNVLFTGDTIFYDCYGRCDLESGSFSDMVLSLRKVFNRFDDVIIYPGHDKEANLSSVKKKLRILVGLKGANI